MWLSDMCFIDTLVDRSNQREGEAAAHDLRVMSQPQATPGWERTSQASIAGGANVRTGTWLDDWNTTTPTEEEYYMKENLEKAKRGMLDM